MCDSDALNSNVPSIDATVSLIIIAFPEFLFYIYTYLIIVWLIVHTKLLLMYKGCMRSQYKLIPKICWNDCGHRMYSFRCMICLEVLRTKLN